MVDRDPADAVHLILALDECNQIIHQSLCGFKLKNHGTDFRPLKYRGVVSHSASNIFTKNEKSIHIYSGRRWIAQSKSLGSMAKYMSRSLERVVIWETLHSLGPKPRLVRADYHIRQYFQTLFYHQENVLIPVPDPIQNARTTTLLSSKELSNLYHHIQDSIPIIFLPRHHEHALCKMYKRMDYRAGGNSTAHMSMA